MPGLRRVEVHAAGFMLDQHTIFRNPRIEELGRIFHEHWHLVLDAGHHVIHAQHLAEKRVPELLIFALLAPAPERPAFHELAGSLFLRCSHLNS